MGDIASMGKVSRRLQWEAFILPVFIVAVAAALLGKWIYERSLERAATEKQRIIGAAINLAAAEVGTNKIFFGVQIRGDQPFTCRILEALFLLKLSSPKDFMFVTHHVKEIQEAPRSSISSDVVSLSETSAFYSVTWCAAGLAHEAYHCYLELDAYRRSEDLLSTLPGNPLEDIKHFYLV